MELIGSSVFWADEKKKKNKLTYVQESFHHGAVIRFEYNFLAVLCAISPISLIAQDSNSTDNLAGNHALEASAFGPLGESTGRYVRPQYVYWENASRGNSQDFVGVALGYQFERQNGTDSLEFEINHGLVGGTWSNSNGYYGDYDHRTFQFLLTYKVGYELSDNIYFYGGLSGGPSLYRHTYTYNGPSTGSHGQWDWVFSVGPTMGLQYEFRPDLSLDLGYRYMMSWGGEYYGRAYQHADAHLLTLGLNYSY